MDETDPEFIEDLDRFLGECHEKSTLLESLRSILFKNETAFRQNFHLVFMRLHNRVEDLLDRILLFYIGPRDLEEETKLTLFAEMEPRGVLNNLIFNFGFDNKLNLVCELFPSISESTKQSIKSLNKIRNGLAHRYKENHRYFLYKKKNVISDRDGLSEFLESFGNALKEISEIEEVLDKYFG